MMNDEKLKNAYRTSENEVPVNIELKRRLIETAKECEKGKQYTKADIRFDAQGKKHGNVRLAITRAAAMAACFALCVCAVPRLTEDGYLGVSNDTAVRETQEPEQTDEVYRAEKTENNTGADSAENHETTSADTNTVTERKSEKTPEQKTSQAITVAELPKTTYGNTAATNNRAEKSETSAADETKAEYEAQTQKEEAQGQSLSDGEYFKDIDTDETDMTDRDELNKRLTMLDKQTAKLESWDSELKRYTGEDSVYDRAYEGFKRKKEEYGGAAESYKAEYVGAKTASELKKGAEEYDSKLSDSGTLFNDCREGYRKCANYAEMNSMEPNGEAEDKVIADEE